MAAIAEEVWVYATANLPHWEATLTIVRERDGTTQYFPIRATCLILGIDSRWQLTAIQADEELSGALREVPMKTPAGWRKVACLRRREYVKWLTQMDPRRAGEKAREKLAAYQEDVLREADRLLFNPTPPAPPDARNTATYTVHVEIHQPCPECGTRLLAVYDNGQAYIIHDREE